jgi:hypothetical protein
VRRLTTATSLCAFLVSIGASDRATGQNMNDQLRPKSDIPQQQADTERKRGDAEAGPKRAEGENGGSKDQTHPNAGNAAPTYQRFVVPLDRDSLARIAPPTYRLENGVNLQVTGGFLPDAPTVCIAHCPSTSMPK